MKYRFINNFLPNFNSSEYLQYTAWKWCISSYLVQMQENTNQKNSEYGHFSRSSNCSKHI